MTILQWFSLFHCTVYWLWTSLTWFSSLHQTWCGTVRPIGAQAVHRSQSIFLPWHRRPLGFSIHHCYLWQGHTPGGIDRQRAAETMTEDQAGYDALLLWHNQCASDESIKCYGLTSSFTLVATSNGWKCFHNISLHPPSLCKTCFLVLHPSVSEKLNAGGELQKRLW